MRRAPIHVGLAPFLDVHTGAGPSGLHRCHDLLDNEQVNLQTLRKETQEQHDAVEGVLPLTGPGLDRDSYRRMLQCFYSVVAGWESWALRHAPARLLPLVNGRRRAALLLRDIEFFGDSPFPTTTEADGEHSRSLPGSLQTLLGDHAPGSAEYDAAFLGAMYVMEGSTLGGQYIARHVEQVLGLVPGQGDAYFHGYGEHTGAMWNGFRQVLGSVPDRHSAVVVAAAKAAFAYVHDNLRLGYLAASALERHAHVLPNPASPPPERDTSAVPQPHPLVEVPVPFEP